VRGGNVRDAGVRHESRKNSYEQSVCGRRLQFLSGTSTSGACRVKFPAVLEGASAPQTARPVDSAVRGVDDLTWAPDQPCQVSAYLESRSSNARKSNSPRQRDGRRSPALDSTPPWDCPQQPRRQFMPRGNVPGTSPVPSCQQSVTKWWAMSRGYCYPRGVANAGLPGVFGIGLMVLSRLSGRWRLSSVAQTQKQHIVCPAAGEKPVMECHRGMTMAPEPSASESTLALTDPAVGSDVVAGGCGKMGANGVSGRVGCNAADCQIPLLVQRATDVISPVDVDSARASAPMLTVRRQGAARRALSKTQENGRFAPRLVVVPAGVHVLARRDYEGSPCSFGPFGARLACHCSPTACAWAGIFALRDSSGPGVLPSIVFAMTMPHNEATASVVGWVRGL